MKESRHANLGAIQAIFLQLSWSEHKLAHSCPEEVKGQMELYIETNFFSEVSVGAFPIWLLPL